MRFSCGKSIKFFTLTINDKVEECSNISRFFPVLIVYVFGDNYPTKVLVCFAQIIAFAK